MDSIDSILYILLIVCIMIVIVLLWYATDDLMIVYKWMKISEEMKQCGKSKQCMKNVFHKYGESENYNKIKKKCKKICGPM